LCDFGQKWAIFSPKWPAVPKKVRKTTKIDIVVCIFKMYINNVKKSLFGTFFGTSLKRSHFDGFL